MPTQPPRPTDSPSRPRRRSARPSSSTAPPRPTTARSRRTYWEFGDGATARAEGDITPTPRPGTYEVTLWVTDDAGSRPRSPRSHSQVATAALAASRRRGRSGPWSTPTRGLRGLAIPAGERVLERADAREPARRPPRFDALGLESRRSAATPVASTSASARVDRAVPSCRRASARRVGRDRETSTPSGRAATRASLAPRAAPAALVARALAP